MASTDRNGFVLDTNIWLDWLVFNDARTHKLQAVVRTQSRVFASAAMRVELAQVLTRDCFKLGDDERQRCLAVFDGVVDMQCDQTLLAPHRLKCSDPDDQMFLDLAGASGATWLLSRDKALLRLARRAQTMGLRIATPETWAKHER